MLKCLKKIMIMIMTYKVAQFLGKLDSNFLHATKRVIFGEIILRSFLSSLKNPLNYNNHTAVKIFRRIKDFYSYQNNQCLLDNIQLFHWNSAYIFMA